MCRCFGQVVSQTRNPSVQSPSKLGTHLSTHCRDEMLSRPCPARDLNPGPVAWECNTLPLNYWASFSIILEDRLTSLGNGRRSISPSHIEMYLGVEVERPGLRGSFLIGRLEGARGCGYGDCFRDIQYDGNFSE
ncbi:hypothetical protein TNCV_202951 [Trichonephila clavipes]|nr:hypothetical protein TNCV_202951 [Trichonephila clavipes]